MPWFAWRLGALGVAEHPLSILPCLRQAFALRAKVSRQSLGRGGVRLGAIRCGGGRCFGMLDGGHTLLCRSREARDLGEI